MGGQDRTTDREIARLAGRSHGVVTRRELLQAGISARCIERRIARGSIIPVHRGVYRVGHAAPSVEARYLAAVRACGHGAVLSGPAAAHLHRLLKGKPPPPEVTAPTERRVPGLRTHRERNLDARDVTTVRRIPTTTVPRTLVDLAAVLTLDQLARACHEAGVLHRTTPRQVEAVLSRKPATRGGRKLRRVLRGDVHVTLSTLERAFLRLLTRNGLPLPETNRPAGGRRVDCRWPEHRLTVELDSYTFHNSRHAWEQDRRREREARSREDEFRRYTYGDVVEDPGYLLAELTPLLTAPPAPSAPRPGGASREPAPSPRPGP